MLAVNVLAFAVNAYIILMDPYGEFRWVSFVALVISGVGLTASLSLILLRWQEKQ